MNIRRIRICLWTTAVGAVLAALSLIGWGVLASDNLPSTTGATHAAASSTRPAEILPPLATFQSLKTIDLQRPLVDSGKSGNKGTLHLVGTILDPGHSAAVLAGPDGHSEMKEVGESFNGAKVIAVEADAVTLVSNGQTVVLRLEKAQ